MNDSVKDGVGYCRITNHVIPVGRWVLRGYDSGFPFMPVLDNFEQDGTFPGWCRQEDVSKWTEPRKSDKRLSGFFVFPGVGKCSQWHFLFFPMLGKPFFADFLFSQCWESRFSPFFDFPPWGKAVFRRFLVFPREGKPIFTDFLFSPVAERRFSLIFEFPSWGKASFCQFSFIVPLRKPPFANFRSAYPYESFFFPFFINCNLYLSDFSWKIDDLCPYLSSFSYWAVSDCWFSKRHLWFDTTSPAVCIACICVLFHYSLELVSKSEVRVRMCNFQAFRAFLHNVALVCCKILRETGRQEEHLSSH